MRPWWEEHIEVLSSASPGLRPSQLLFQDMLCGSDMAMRIRSARAYEFCRYRYGYRKLLRLARSLYPPDPDREVHEFFFALLNALAATGTDEAEEFVGFLMRESGETESYTDGNLRGAILAATILGGERAGNLLRPFIHAPTAFRRQSVLDAFVAIGDHEEDIARFLEDPDQGIRLHAQFEFSDLSPWEFFKESNWKK